MFCIIQTNISKQCQKIKKMETLPYDKVLMKLVFKTDFFKPGVGNLQNLLISRLNQSRLQGQFLDINWIRTYPSSFFDKMIKEAVILQLQRHMDETDIYNLISIFGLSWI